MRGGKNFSTLSGAPSAPTCKGRFTAPLALPSSARFVVDSALEGIGFELPVPEPPGRLTGRGKGLFGHTARGSTESDLKASTSAAFSGQGRRHHRERQILLSPRIQMLKSIC